MVARQLILITLVATGCFGQRIEVGAKVGVPVTAAFETASDFHSDFGESATSATRRYTLGPSIGVQLWRRFSLESDALYKPLGFDQLVKTGGVLFAHTRTTADSWEFPVVAKFRFLSLPVVSPYVAGGVSFRHSSRVSSVMQQYVGAIPNSLTQSTGSNSATLANRSGRGGVVGVGTEIHVAFLRVSPEVRYTRWGADRNVDPELHSNENQAEVLLGVTF
jgi:hypothetical protein